MKKAISKTISSLLIITIVMTSSHSYGYPTLFKTKSHAQRFLQDEEELQSDIIVSPSSLCLPQKLGRVVEYHKGKKGSLVIHIQDRHADPVCQLNIAGIIDEFVSKYDTELICLEGASKELDTSFYDRFPDNSIKRKTSEFFLDKGIFTGAEFYKITNKDKYIRAQGVEDKKAYLQHLSIYKSNGIDKEQILGFLKAIGTSLNALKDEAYSKDLKGLDKAASSYHLKQTKLPEYLKELGAYSDRAGCDISKHENLSRFIELVKKEERIDFRKAEEQREAVIKELSDMLDEADLDILINKSLEFRLGKITQEEFYDYLYTLIEQEKINKPKYKNLTAYVDYIRFSKSINHLAVFDEAEEAEEEVKLALCDTDIQRDLVLYSKAVDILKDLYTFKLTHRQLDYMEAKNGFSDISKIQYFLKTASSRYGLALNPVISETHIDQYAIDRSRKYYQVALKRDIALIDNTLDRMERDRKDKAILITGGFHTEGITNILKEKDISYVVLCPNIGAGDYEEVYAARMAGKLPDITELAEFFRHTLVVPLLAGDMKNPDMAAKVQKLFKALCESDELSKKGALEKLGRIIGTPVAEDGKHAIVKAASAGQTQIYHDIDTLNQDVERLEAQLQSIGVENIPRMGFHGELAGHEMEGDIWYFLFDPNLKDYWREYWQKNDLDARFKLINKEIALDNVFMAKEEFFERLFGTIIFISDYAKLSLSEERYAELYLFRDALGAGFELRDNSAKEPAATVFISTPGTGIENYRFLNVEGREDAEHIPEEAVAAKIGLSDEEIKAIKNWADSYKTELADPHMLNVTYFAKRLLYKKVLDELVSITKPSVAAKTSSAGKTVNLNSLDLDKAEMIGRGDFGVVFKIPHRETSQEYAVKVYLCSERQLHWQDSADSLGGYVLRLSQNHPELVKAGRMPRFYENGMCFIKDDGNISRTATEKRYHYTIMDYASGDELEDIARSLSEDTSKAHTVAKLLTALMAAKAVDAYHSDGLLIKDMSLDQFILQGGKGICIVDQDTVVPLDYNWEQDPDEIPVLARRIIEPYCSEDTSIPWSNNMSDLKLLNELYNRQWDIYVFAFVLLDILDYRASSYIRAVSRDTRAATEIDRDDSMESLGVNADNNFQENVRIYLRSKQLTDTTYSIISKCLEKNRKLRYTDMKPVIKDLSEHLLKAKSASAGSVEEVLLKAVASLNNRPHPLLEITDVDENLKAKIDGLERSLKLRTPEETRLRSLIKRYFELERMVHRIKRDYVSKGRIRLLSAAKWTIFSHKKLQDALQPIIWNDKPTQEESEYDFLSMYGIGAGLETAADRFFRSHEAVSLTLEGFSKLDGEMLSDFQNTGIAIVYSRKIEEDIKMIAVDAPDEDFLLDPFKIFGDFLEAKQKEEIKKQILTAGALRDLREEMIVRRGMKVDTLPFLQISQGPLDEREVMIAEGVLSDYIETIVVGDDIYDMFVSVNKSMQDKVVRASEYFSASNERLRELAETRDKIINIVQTAGEDTTGETGLAKTSSAGEDMVVLGIGSKVYDGYGVEARIGNIERSLEGKIRLEVRFPENQFYSEADGLLDDLSLAPSETEVSAKRHDIYYDDFSDLRRASQIIGKRLEHLVEKLKVSNAEFDEWLIPTIEYLKLLSELCTMSSLSEILEIAVSPGYGGFWGAEIRNQMAVLEQFLRKNDSSTYKDLIALYRRDNIEPYYFEKYEFEYPLGEEEIKSAYHGLKKRFESIKVFYSGLGIALEKLIPMQNRYYPYIGILATYEGMLPYLDKMKRHIPAEVLGGFILQQIGSNPGDLYALCQFLLAAEEGDLYEDIGKFYQMAGEIIPEQFMPVFWLEPASVKPGIALTETDFLGDIAGYFKKFYKTVLGDDTTIFAMLLDKNPANNRAVWKSISREFEIDGIEGPFLYECMLENKFYDMLFSKEGILRLSDILQKRYGFDKEAADSISKAVAKAEEKDEGDHKDHIIDCLENILNRKDLRSKPQFADLLIAISEKAKDDILGIYKILNDIAQEKFFSSHVRSLIDMVRALKGKTMVVVFKALFKYENKGLMNSLEDEKCLENHYDFYTYIAHRYGNAAGLIIEGIISGINKGILDKRLAESEKKNIEKFCDGMNSFSPVLYRAYRDSPDREALVAAMKKAEQATRDDAFTPKEIEALIKLSGAKTRKEKHEFVLAVYLTVIPPRDTSFLSIDDAIEMVGESIEEGRDFRKDVPAALRAYKRRRSLTSVRKVRTDKWPDHSEAIKSFLKRIKAKGKPEPVSEEELLKAVLSYANGQMDIDGLRELLELYLYNHKDFQSQLRIVLSERNYYTRLNKLSTLLEDTIKHYLEPVQKKISEAAKAQGVFRKLTNKAGMIKQLQRVPVEALERILSAISTEDMLELQKELEQGISDEQRLKEVMDTIDRLLADRDNLAVSKAKRVDIVKTAWASELQVIKDEIESFASQEEGKTDITFRVVKGLPYVIWGLNCGVCVAKDYELWSDEFFFLLSIVDEETGMVEGFVHLYDYEMTDGKRVLLAPGINPTSELLARVDSNEMLDEIILALQDIAKKEGYDAVYIPSSEFIYSNHQPIKKAINAKGFKEMLLPAKDSKIEWAKGHPIDEVFDVTNVKIKPKAQAKTSSAGMRVEELMKPIRSLGTSWARYLEDVGEDPIEYAFDVFGPTPKRYGLIIYDRMLRGAEEEKNILKALSQLRASRGAKFEIIVSTTEGREDLIEKWGISADNIRTTESFLSERKASSAGLSENEKVIACAEILRKQMPVGIAAPPDVYADRLAGEINSSREKGEEYVFVTSQRPADVMIDGYKVRSFVVSEMAIIDILHKLKDYGQIVIELEKLSSEQQTALLFEMLPAVNENEITDYIQKLEVSAKAASAGA